MPIEHLPRASATSKISLRFSALKCAGTNYEISSNNYSCYQLISMPVDTNRAGYVRQTGLNHAAGELPRALFPLDNKGGAVDVEQLRDPAYPFDPNSHPMDSTVFIWVDVHVPVNAATGDYTGTCELIASDKSASSAQTPINLHVFDFSIPAKRNLLMVSKLDWNDLNRLYENQFEAITPRLIQRGDPTYDSSLKVLDQLVSLAEENRAEVVIPRLQPTVTHLPGQPMVVDWDQFHSVVDAWMNGTKFADKNPLGFWPIPQPDFSDQWDAETTSDYWSKAGSEFNTSNWINRTAVLLQRDSAAPQNEEAARLSAEGQLALAAHSMLNVSIPLHEAQLQFGGKSDNRMLDRKMSSRIISNGDGLVSASHDWPADWPNDIQHLLNLDSPGLASYVGAGGDEGDVRLWAWLAYWQTKRVNLILWGNPLPPQDHPNELADANGMVWFYPGQWFGINRPVPTVQLKWLRRAEQDYEYLLLAESHHAKLSALVLSQLMAKPVQLEKDQTPDAVYGLIAGAVDQKTWEQARGFLAQMIQSDGKDDRAFNLALIDWEVERERPYIVARSSQWLWDPTAPPGENWLTMKLGADFYNDSGDTRTQNLLQWKSAGYAWEFQPQPFKIAALQWYRVERFFMQARVNLDRLNTDSRRPLDFNYINGDTNDTCPAEVVVPIAFSDRREGNTRIDGKLDEWLPIDLLHSGPLTKMLDRPTVQHSADKWKTRQASSDSKIYSGWSDDSFYLAFDLTGLGPAGVVNQNYVDYDYGRAWGQDVAEVNFQPVYDDNSVGPATFIWCLPNGMCSHSRPDVKYNAGPTGGTHWTGELAISWKLLLGAGKDRPRLLRFNFIQHAMSTGESASWAGPIDVDQDTDLMGALYLRDIRKPGPR